MTQLIEWQQDQRNAARLKSILEERTDLFKRFRAKGWQIDVIDVNYHPGLYVKHPDGLPSNECHFLVKMPGAAPARIRTVAQLLRLVKGVAQ